MEIAFVSTNKMRLELEKNRETNASGALSVFTQDAKQYIATMLVGNNIALVIYGISMSALLESCLSGHIDSGFVLLLIQTLVSTILILFIAEFLPKTIFRIQSTAALNMFAIPVYFFYIIFYPIAWFTVKLSGGILKSLFRVRLDSEDNIVFGKVDLDHFVTESRKYAEPESEIGNDMKIFQNALDFSKVRLRECFVPRTEIAAIDLDDSIENLTKLFVSTNFSKILVYKDSIDNIVGYVHSLELFKNPKSIKVKLQQVLFVPETMPASKLLNLFMKEYKSIAVVVDEFGGTAGMVTIEDIIEEIFGEIEDEHDTVDFVEKKIKEGEYILSGRLEIDYLNEKYGFKLPGSEEYETLAGHILHHHESIPEVGENIEIAPFKFRILNVSQTKIELVKMTWGGG